MVALQVSELACEARHLHEQDFGVADSLQTMMRRGKTVRARLSSHAYCDLMHASGVDLSSSWMPVSDSCCVAGDGAPRACKGGSSAGRGAQKVESGK